MSKFGRSNNSYDQLRSAILWLIFSQRNSTMKGAGVEQKRINLTILLRQQGRRNRGWGQGGHTPPHFFAKKRKEQKGQRDRESMKKEKKVIIVTNNNPFLMKQRQDSAHDIRKNNRNNNFILLTFFSMYFCLSFYSLAD